MRGQRPGNVNWFSLNSLIILSSAASGVFLAGGYYFSMQQKYERLIEKLELQLDRERVTREMHDDRMLERLNHERDQQSLALAHLRRSYESALYDLQISINKQLFDIAFHGDYEKFREDVGNGIRKTINEVDNDNWTGDPNSISGFPGLLAKTAAFEIRREINKKTKPVEQVDLYSHGDQDPSGYILVYVKNFIGTRLCELYVTNNLSVRDLKYIIEDETLIPSDNQNLFFKGKKLQDGPSIGDYNLTDGSVLHVRKNTPSNNQFRKQTFMEKSPLDFLLSKKDEVKNRRHEREQYKLMPQAIRDFLIEKPDSIRELIEPAFIELDKNQDGVLSLEELKAFLYRKMPDATATDVNKIIRMMDTDDSEFINFEEWKTFWNGSLEEATRSGAISGKSNIINCENDSSSRSSRSNNNNNNNNSNGSSSSGNNNSNNGDSSCSNSSKSDSSNSNDASNKEVIIEMPNKQEDVPTKTI